MKVHVEVLQEALCAQAARLRKQSRRLSGVLETKVCDLIADSFDELSDRIWREADKARKETPQ